jgi:RNA polymerase primary sigma factor
VALLVGNAGQTDWYLAYQPDDLSVAGSPGRLVTLRLGHEEENLHRQAHALSGLKTYDAHDDPLSLLELAEAYEDVFAKAKPQIKSPGRSKDGIELLLSEIGRYPLLTARQEGSILAELDELSDTIIVGEGEQAKSLRVADGDDYDRYHNLRDMIINRNLRLCFSISKRYAINSDEFLDLFQEAVIGLMRAIDHFDVNRKVRLSTYAYRVIQQSVVKWIRKHRYFFRMRSCTDQTKTGRPEAVKSLPILDQGEVQSSDLIDDTSHSPGSIADAEAIRLAVGLSLTKLSERESIILIHRFGLYNSRKQTLAEIAHELGVTRERVRQIESRALGRLRTTLTPIQRAWEETGSW